MDIWFPTSATASTDLGCRTATDALHTPRRRLGRSVLALGALCMLAGLAVAATILLHRAGHERQAIETQALALARSTAFAAEREVATTFARLEGLSTTPALRSDDLSALHAQLARTPAPPGSWFAVADATGELVNTLLPFGDPRLPRNWRDRPAGLIPASAILREDRPYVDGVVWAPIAQIYTVSIGIPVVLGPDGRRGALIAPVPQQRMLALLQEQPLPPQWRATLVDQSSNIVARIEPATVPASPVPPNRWWPRLQAESREALFLAEAAAGAPMLTAIAPASALGWNAVVEVPLAALEAPRREALYWIFLTAGVLFILGSAVAWWLKGRIEQSVCALTQAAGVAEERQRQTAMYFRHYLDNTPEGLFMVRVTPEEDFVFECMNPAYERATGLRDGETSGRRLEECLSGETFSAMRRSIWECADRGAPVRFLEVRELANGRREWETTLSPIRDPEGGRATVLFGTTRDITEHRRAEEALRLSEERLRLAQRAAGAVVWDCDLETGRVHWSPDMRDLLGFDLDSGGRTNLKAFLRGFIHPDDQRHVEARLQAAVATGGQFEAEFRYIRGGPGGELRWMAARGGVATTVDGRSPAFGTGAAKRRVVGVSVDVTDRRRAELAARDSLALVQSSLDALVAQVAILDANLRIVTVNNPWRRVASTDRSLAANPLGWDYIAACRAMHWSASEAANIQVGLRAVAEGAAGEFRREHVRKDPATGQERWLQIRITRFGVGASLRLVVAHEDITEVRQSAEALKAMAGRMLTLQEEERRRIARELHDTTLQDLAMTVVSIDMATLAEAKEVRTQSLLEGRKLLEQIMRDVRTLSYLLHPPLLDVCGLAVALSAYTKGFALRSGIECELCLENTPHGSIPANVGVAMFRVAQEAFANVHRHSAAKRMHVSLCVNAEMVELRVEDDGRGFEGIPNSEAEDASRVMGVGIPGMRARVRQLRGKLDIKTSQDGTTIIAIVPLDGTAEIEGATKMGARSDIYLGAA
jgi:two-component system NarL family sensor kinase